MSTEQLFEIFEKTEQILTHQSHSLTPSHRERIANKFANKSLQELNDIASQLLKQRELHQPYCAK
jgi:hypothetical protein